MTLPVLLFGLVIAVLIGSIFHLVRGGSGWGLVLCLFLSILGFSVGQFIRIYLGWHVYTFGYLDIGLGVIGSVLFLAGNDVYGRLRSRNKTSV